MGVNVEIFKCRLFEKSEVERWKVVFKVEAMDMKVC